MSMRCPRPRWSGTALRARARASLAGRRSAGLRQALRTPAFLPCASQALGARRQRRSRPGTRAHLTKGLAPARVRVPVKQLAPVKRLTRVKRLAPRKRGALVRPVLAKRRIPRPAVRPERLVCAAPVRHPLGSNTAPKRRPARRSHVSRHGQSLTLNLPRIQRSGAPSTPPPQGHSQPGRSRRATRQRRVRNQGKRRRILPKCIAKPPHGRRHALLSHTMKRRPTLRPGILSRITKRRSKDKEAVLF